MPCVRTPLGLADLVNLLVSAVLLAGIYTAMSIGMTVIYGVMKMVNLAHAGFMMLGAYFAYELSQRTPLDPLLAAILAAPLFFLLGIATYWSMVRRIPVADVPTLPSLLLLFGLWLVLQNIGYAIWGADDRSILTPLTMATVRLGEITIPIIRVIVFGVALLSLASLHVFLTRTWFGRAVRALTQNREAGQLVGIDTQRTAMLTFGLGIAFTGLAGALLATLYSFTPDFGGSFMLRSFVIIVLGGLESFSGVAIGAIIVALIETFSILVVPASYQLAISFILLVVALLVMPGGIEGMLQRRRRL
ncbi:MAG TPA: branched-chain amino acid ABC transporter permease [Candidatus Acidoferrum sp.]|nr:branched-chain amino acid ABC transporter permease [Candidatus Acidoferrum sp.]